MLAAVRYRAEEPQGELFPSAAGVLSLPLADLELYRGKREILRPGYVTLQYAIRDDQRYVHLLDLLERGGYAVSLGLGILEMIAGFSLYADPIGLLAMHDGRTPLAEEDAIRFWRLPPGELVVWRPIVMALTTTKLLLRTNLDQPEVVDRYREETRRIRIARARVRKMEVDDPECARRRTDAVDGQMDINGGADAAPAISPLTKSGGEDGRKTNAAPARGAGPTTTGCRGTTPQGDGAANTTGPPPATGGFAGPKATGGASRQEILTVANDLATQVNAQMDRLHRGWHYVPLAGEPRSYRDRQNVEDLASAVANALRTGIGRLRALEECLVEAAGWAQSGAGFHRAMQDAGFLARRKAPR